MEAGNFKDALSLLEKSLKMNKQVMGEDHHSNCLIYIAMAHVHQRLKDYETSTNLLFQVWEIYQAQFGSGSLEVGKVYLELALAHLKKKDTNEAISFQQKALKVHQDIAGDVTNQQQQQEGESPISQDTVADIAITLSEWLEKADRIEEALESLKFAEQIFEYSYSVIDKRTCKVKRNVALLYLKSNRYDEALDVLKEVEELERTLYGEASTQLAKTYKVIGTLYIINSSPQEAREYLLRALGIFEAKGLIKLLKEVKSKLKMLNSSVKMAAEMAAQEAVDGGSGDDSGREGSPSGDRKQGSAGRSGNKRKFAMPNGVALAAAKKKKVQKKTVFRNNFVKESDSNA